MRLGPHTIVVLRASTAGDDYGNSAPDWATAAETTVEGCSVQPQIGLENTVGRDTVVPRWTLYAPDDADLLATDRVRFDGDDYEVDGEPQRWEFPPLAHLVALLQKVT